jgi:hypothetical protein
MSYFVDFVLHSRRLPYSLLTENTDAASVDRNAIGKHLVYIGYTRRKNPTTNIIRLEMRPKQRRQSLHHPMVR